MIDMTGAFERKLKNKKSLETHCEKKKLFLVFPSSIITKT